MMSSSLLLSLSSLKKKKKEMTEKKTKTEKTEKKIIFSAVWKKLKKKKMQIISAVTAAATAQVMSQLISYKYISVSNYLSIILTDEEMVKSSSYCTKKVCMCVYTQVRHLSRSSKKNQSWWMIWSGSIRLLRSRWSCQQLKQTLSIIASREMMTSTKW